MKLAQIKLAQWKLASWRSGGTYVASGFSLGSTAVVKFGGNLTDISAYLDSFELQRSTHEVKTTGLLNTAQTRKALDNKNEAVFTGFFDPTIQSLLAAGIGTSATFQYSPAGTASGYTTYSGTATLDSVTIKSSIQDANRIECGLKIHGLTYATN